jgi:crotonobetainyl-CoA:carnitine CoA-transferase CaiB-like acyl-CoA transferase
MDRLAVGSERQWPRFWQAIGAAEMTEDSRFATNDGRAANRETLRPLIAALLVTAPSATRLKRLAATDVRLARSTTSRPSRASGRGLRSSLLSRR